MTYLRITYDDTFSRDYKVSSTASLQKQSEKFADSFIDELINEKIVSSYQELAKRYREIRAKIHFSFVKVH